MLSAFSPDEEEALLDELARRRVAAAQEDTAGTVGQMPAALADAFSRAGRASVEEAPPVAAAAPVARPQPSRVLPSLTPIPGAPDLSAARASDADAQFRRGLEMAARQAIAGIGLQRAPTEADLVTQAGQAEAQAVRDAAAARQRALDERSGQESDRAALLRQMAIEAGADPEVRRMQAEAKMLNAQTLAKQAEGNLALGERKVGVSERLADIQSERVRRIGAGGGARAAERKAAAEAKAAAKKEEADMKRAEGLPFGYRLREGANPSKKQREDAATAVEQRDAILPIIDELDAAVKSGAQRLVDPRMRAVVAQRAQQIGAAIRTIENLGVPSGPDVQIALQLIGDPTSPLNEVAGVMPELLKNLRSYFNTKTDTRLRTFGIEKEPSGETPAPARRIAVNKKTGERRFVNPDGTLGEVAP